MHNCQPHKCYFPTALYTAAEGRNCFIIPNEHLTSVFVRFEFINWTSLFSSFIHQEIIGLLNGAV